MFTSKLLLAARMPVCRAAAGAFKLVYLESHRRETFQAPDIYCLRGAIKQWVFVDQRRPEVYRILCGKYT